MDAALGAPRADAQPVRRPQRLRFMRKAQAVPDRRSRSDGLSGDGRKLVRRGRGTQASREPAGNGGAGNGPGNAGGGNGTGNGGGSNPPGNGDGGKKPDDGAEGNNKKDPDKENEDPDSAEPSKPAAAGDKEWRTEPQNLEEGLGREEAKAGAGKRIMKGDIKDPKYPQDVWAKMHYSHERADGRYIVIHYWQNLETGAREGFKFKND